MLLDITNYIFEHPTALNLTMTGFWVSDRTYHSQPCVVTLPHVVRCLAVLGWDVVQTQIPAVDFVHKYESVFSFKYVSTLPMSLAFE